MQAVFSAVPMDVHLGVAPLDVLKAVLVVPVFHVQVDAVRHALRYAWRGVLQLWLLCRIVLMELKEAKFAIQKTDLQKSMQEESGKFCFFSCSNGCSQGCAPDGCSSYQATAGTEEKCSRSCTLGCALMHALL